MTPLGSAALRRAAAPRPENMTLDERRSLTARAVVAIGRQCGGEQLTAEDQAAIAAFEPEPTELDARRKAVVDQVILAGKMRRNEAP